MLTILALEKLRQKDCKFEASLGYQYKRNLRCIANKNGLKQRPQGSAPPLAAAVSFASNEATFSASPYLSHLLPRSLCLSAYETPYPRM